MKGLLFQQQQQQQEALDQENMSNLTSASSDQASVNSSGNRTEISYDPQEYLAQTQPPKKKRNLPGNPDPEAEVIALSPKTLLAKNRFICEFCNKGFQRDQNLQLHRRGHNLPWKLKQRTSKEIRKKVYVCPEVGCAHHEPSRALGDLTGIKKHFCRKHGEKKWKCEKCSKKYAVQSDWKAHSKTCGTREYRCDCGTLFSRRDSFITHRAFCDALAEESARAITANPLLSSTSTSSLNQLRVPQYNNSEDLHSFSLKKELPWLPSPHFPIIPSINHLYSSSSPSLFSTKHVNQKSQFTQTHLQNHETQNPNPILLGPINNNNKNNVIFPPYQSSTPSSHMSATALLQKAAQMGATMSSTCTMRTPLPHVSDSSSHTNTSTCSNFGLNMSSRDHDQMVSTDNNGLIDLMNYSVSSSSNGFDQGSSLIFNEEVANNSDHDQAGLSTRDFLGLRGISRSDFLNIAGFGMDPTFFSNSSKSNS